MAMIAEMLVTVDWQLLLCRPENAPAETLMLVHGSGGWRLGIKDDRGNWRARHNGPMKGTPNLCLFLPDFEKLSKGIPDADETK